MPYRSLLFVLLAFTLIETSATDVTIDASKLKGKSSIFIGESGILQRIPESGIIVMNIENLPTLIKISSIQKGKVSTLEVIWLMGDSLSISGSVAEERIDLSPEENGRLSEVDPEDEWKTFLKDKDSSSPSRPLLVHVLNLLKFQDTEDLETLASRVAESDEEFWAAEKIQTHLNELGKVGYDSEEETFHSLTATDKSGESVTFRQTENKYLLIDFSSSGCRPCLLDIDQLVSLQQDFTERLEILSLWDDPKHETWLNVGKEQKDKINWPSFRDDSRAVFTKFEVDVYPTYVLIDPEGKVVKRWKGSGIGKVRKYFE